MAGAGCISTQTLPLHLKDMTTMIGNKYIMSNFFDTHSPASSEKAVTPDCSARLQGVRLSACYTPTDRFRSPASQTSLTPIPGDRFVKDCM